MTYVFLLLTTLVAAEDKIVPPASVTGLLKNCVSGETKQTLGPKQVCYPHDPKMVSADEYRGYQKKADDISSQGIPINRLGYYVGRWLEVSVSNCRRVFAEKLAKGGLTPGQATLAWADAVVFSKGVTKPQILINAIPQGSASGGLIVVLPDYEWCGNQDKLVAMFKEVDKQWNRLVKLSNMPSDRESELERAFNDPKTVFQVVATEQSCRVETYAHSAYIPDERKRRSILASYQGKRSVYGETVGRQNEATRQALRALQESMTSFTENQLSALAEKGIQVEPGGIVIRGKRYTTADLYPPPKEGGMFSFEPPHKVAERLGVDVNDFMSAQMVQMQVQQGHLMNYRKENPLPKNQVWMMGPGGKETKADLPQGCEYDPAAMGGVRCSGGFGGFGGMMGGGFGLGGPGMAAPAAPPPGNTF